MKQKLKTKLTGWKQSWRSRWDERSARQKAVTVGSIFGCLVGSFFIAYAISSWFSSKSFVINNTKGSVFSIDLTGSISGIEVVPGSEQSVAPSIENTGTEPMYVFIRFDVGTTASNTPVYSFTPDGTAWSAVETEDAGELLYVYGSGESLVSVEPGDSAEIPGTLTCIADGSDFVMLEDVKVRVTGCAIGSVGEDGNAAEVYRDYIEMGGE